jgi:hypothetical protein
MPIAERLAIFFWRSVSNDSGYWYDVGFINSSQRQVIECRRQESAQSGEASAEIAEIVERDGRNLPTRMFRKAGGSFDLQVRAVASACLWAMRSCVPSS